MFKIKFNTKDFNSHKRRNWNDQIYNDFAVAINGIEYICDTKEDALSRMEFIYHGYSSSIDFESNLITLEDPRYGKQIMKIALPGFALGYVDLEKAIEKAELEGINRIPFGSFYDLRQGNFFKGCFIEISMS
jgi:hypothetical protein